MKLLFLVGLLLCYAIAAPVVSTEDPPITHFVTFKIAHGDEVLGDVKLGLFGSVVPKTAENFYDIATGKVKDKTYTGTIFHRIIDKFMIQGGDFENFDGTGGSSIYGKKFADENFNVKHDKLGRLSMANSGKDTNGSQFFITTTITSWLDGKHVVFGQVVEGLDLVLEKIQKVKTGKNDRPVEDVKIIEVSGEPNQDVNDMDVKEYEEIMRPGLSTTKEYLIFFAVVGLLVLYVAIKVHQDRKTQKYTSMRD